MAKALSFKKTMEGAQNPRILALDIGTTTLRAHIYDQNVQLCSSADQKIEVLYPQANFYEMCPNTLWSQVQDVIKRAIANARKEASDITCMGITNQRNTFITWDKETGEPFHNFVTWQDMRASDFVKSWNNSYTMTGLNKGSKLLHLVTRKKRFLAASVLRFKSAQLRKRAEEKQVYYGCLETWLLWKLTNGEVFATDYSCASSTGMFDPFQMEWSSIVSSLVGIPMHILPEIKDTSGHFGNCAPEIFGAPIPITAIVADQQAAMFGQCCFELGDVKCTMGTGTFIDCNTGPKPHASIAGLYPLIGWKIGSELVFIAEGLASDTGLCIEWLKKLGLFNEVERLSELAGSVEDSGGVYFVPAFSGIQAPVNDDKACSSLIGITPDTGTPHIVRAVLEALAFRFKLLYQTIQSETKTPLSKLVKCDGGVCNNDFVMQLVSNLIGARIDRPDNMDMTSVGAAFLAGLAVGVWKDKEDLKRLRKTKNVYEPQNVHEKYDIILADWQKAVKRSRHWYQDVPS